MYEVLYQGVDTLDVAFKGAFPQEVLDMLETAKNGAEKMHNDTHGYGIVLGADQQPFFVKSHGKKGGFRYVFIDDPTGAIFAVKADSNPDNWNFFVSARARGLLCRTYEGMKAHMENVLQSIGATIKEVSVNRLDYAVDIAATNFDLEMRNFVAPRKAKVQGYFATENDLDDDGNKMPAPKPNDISAVMCGGRFESVTVGKMPRRQVILYDKLKAAKDLKTDFWFDVWRIDRNDPGTQVWRVEIRCGRDSFANYIGKAFSRNYETVESVLPRYLTKAAQDIRYVTSKEDVSNITRANVHPLWKAAQIALTTLPVRLEPAMPRAYVLELMRKQKVAMAEAQAFGNLNNQLILEGFSSEEIQRHYSRLSAKRAQTYLDNLGDEQHSKKLALGKEKLGVFLKID